MLLEFQIDLMMRNEMGVGIEEGNGGLGLKGICEGTNSRLCENDKVCISNSVSW